MKNLQQLDTKVASTVGEHDETDTTLAVVVQHRGEVVAEAYADGVSADTTLISWSMAKSVTHALVGMAQMDGLLDVHAPTGIALWQNDDRRNITLQHLLEMRSGLAWIEDYVEGNESDVIDMLFGSGKEDHATHAINKPLASAPGSEWYYSSGTTNIVARLLGNARMHLFRNVCLMQSECRVRLCNSTAPERLWVRLLYMQLHEILQSLVSCIYVMASAVRNKCFQSGGLITPEHKQ